MDETKDMDATTMVEVLFQNIFDEGKDGCWNFVAEISTFDEHGVHGDGVIIRCKDGSVFHIVVTQLPNAGG